MVKDIVHLSGHFEQYFVMDRKPLTYRDVMITKQRLLCFAYTRYRATSPMDRDMPCWTPLRQLV